MLAEITDASNYCASYFPDILCLGVGVTIGRVSPLCAYQMGAIMPTQLHGHMIAGELFRNSFCIPTFFRLQLQMVLSLPRYDRHQVFNVSPMLKIMYRRYTGTYH
jgi:hypothetical protein